MFENILHQTLVITQLKADLDAAILAPSILFSGPEYAGKGTAAAQTIFGEDARDAQAFVDRWKPRVEAMPNARHAKMLRVILGVASRISGDDHVVAGLQRLARHALSAELESSAPFDGVADRVALLVFPFDVHERVRVAKQELHQVAFDLRRLVLEVRGGKRVMRERGRCVRHHTHHRQQPRRCRDREHQPGFHVAPPARLAHIPTIMRADECASVDTVNTWTVACHSRMSVTR